MNTTNTPRWIKSRHMALVLATGMAVMGSGMAQAAALAVADSPLVVGSGVDPNVMIVIDSSGSMTSTVSTGVTRQQAAKTAMKAVLDDMDDVYIGLAQYDTGSNCYQWKKGSTTTYDVTITDNSWSCNSGNAAATDSARILQGMTALDSTSRATMKTTVDNIGASGGTPLSETLESVGLYFTQDTAGRNGNIILHPGAAGDNWEYDELASNVFSTVPEYAAAVNTTENPMRAWCQKHNIIFVTDGDPSVDQSPSTHLRDYDGDCNNTYGAADTVCGSPSSPTTAASPPHLPLDFDKKTGTGYSYDAGGGGGSDYFDDVAAALYEIDLRPSVCDPELLDEAEDFYGDAVLQCEDLVKTGSVFDGQPNAGTGHTYREVCDFEVLEEIRDNGTGTELCDNAAMSAADRSSNNYRFVDNITTYVVGFGTGIGGYKLLDNAMAQGTGGAKTAALSATNATTLTESLSTLFNSIRTQASGTLATVAFNSTSLKSGTNTLFYAKYDSTKWKGQFFNVQLTDTGYFTDGTNTSADIRQVSPRWEAGSILDAITDSSVISNRVVYSFNGAGTGTGILFKSADATEFAALPLALRNDVRMKNSDTINTPTGAADGSGTDGGIAKLDYLRGNRAAEGTTFRSRDSRLGDIVDSAPVFVGATAGIMGWPAVAPFPVSPNAYSEWTVSRNPVVYVGANDGMLHGFDGDPASGGSTNGGSEVMAYAPGFLASAGINKGYHYLTEKDYDHLYYVDGTPTVSDVYINPNYGSGTGTNQWRTVLVGGMRAGGMGIYALDVTNPSSFSNTATAAANTVLWEFTSSNDADLGLTFSTPTVAMLKNDKWGVILGNGYNNTGSGTAKLFILYLEQGIDGWAAADYKEIDTGVGSTTTPNGLSTPRVVDTDGDRIADTVYAGDIYGNLWAFDLSGNASGWGSKYKSGSIPKPLFQTSSTSTTTPSGMPFTAQPIVARLPGDTNVVVYAGTGMYLQRGDIGTLTQQYMIAVQDRGTKELGFSNLEGRTTTWDTTTTPGQTLITISGSDVDWTADYGWYMALQVNSTDKWAERIVSPAAVRGTVLFVNSIIPYSVADCGAGSGLSALYALDYKTGLATPEAAFDVDGDDDIDEDDQGFAAEVLDGLSPESGFIEDYRFTPTSEGDLVRDKVKTFSGSGPQGRMGWEEILPY